MLSNLELHRARLKALGGSAEERLQREKLKSLESALKYSYQSERVYKDGIEYSPSSLAKRLIKLGCTPTKLPNPDISIIIVSRCFSRSKPSSFSGSNLYISFVRVFR